MIQTRLSKTNIRVNWGKESRPSVWPQFLFSKKKMNFHLENWILFRQCHFHLKSTNFEPKWGFWEIFNSKHVRFLIKMHIFKFNFDQIRQKIIEFCLEISIFPIIIKFVVRNLAILAYFLTISGGNCDSGKNLAKTRKWQIFGLFVS